MSLPINEWTSNHSALHDILRERTRSRMASPYCWTSHPLHR